MSTTGEIFFLPENEKKKRDRESFFILLREMKSAYVLSNRQICLHLLVIDHSFKQVYEHRFLSCCQNVIGLIIVNRKKVLIIFISNVLTEVTLNVSLLKVDKVKDRLNKCYHPSVYLRKHLSMNVT